MPISSRAATTLDKIRESGFLLCGIDRSEAEFSLNDRHGARLGFDQAICMAVAVAVLGPGAKIVFKTYPDDQTSITALNAGAIDLIATLSLDLSHRKNPALSFTRTLLYDGEALMVPRKLNLNKPEDLSSKNRLLT